MLSPEQNNFLTANQLIKKALVKDQGFAFWRLPANDQIEFICGPVEKKLLKDTKGFLISSFEGETFFIHQKYKTLIRSDLQEDEKEIKTGDLYKGTFFTENFKNTSEKEYLQECQKAIDNIYARRLKKLVLARKIKVNLEENFNPFHFFLKLSKKYPDAFVSFISLPDTGSWIGASPETLLNLNNGRLSTVSLAGTSYLSAGSVPTLNDFTEKELAEQELVSEYIRNVFKTSGIGFSEEQAKAVNAGHLIHIKGKFNAEINSKTDWLNFLNNLHPTPAVCGLPKTIAFDYILKHENFKRQLYSGYLGPVNADQNVNLFVNLRCMQIYDQTGIIYTGAGIIEGSDPALEWQETGKKAETLLRILFPDKY